MQHRFKHDTTIEAKRTMTYLLLTRAKDGKKQMVNMALVSEAVRSNSNNYTRLVVPSAVFDDEYVDVRETLEEIATMIGAERRVGATPA